MTAVGRAAVVALLAVAALAAGFGVSRLVYGTERLGPAPVIDLDNLPPTDAPPIPAEPEGAGTVVPVPTVPQAPAPAPPSTATTVAPVPATTAATVIPDDDADDDAFDGDDDGAVDD